MDTWPNFAMEAGAMFAMGADAESLPELREEEDELPEPPPNQEAVGMPPDVVEFDERVHRMKHPELACCCCSLTVQDSLGIFGRSVNLHH